MNPLSSASKSRLSRYRKIIVWLATDIKGLYGHLVFKIFVAFVSSLVFKFLALLILSKYIHLVQSSPQRVLQVRQFSLPVESHEFLALAAISCLVIFILSFAAKYWGEVALLRLMADYEIFCTRRAAGDIARYGGDERLKPWQPYFLNIIGTDVRYCGLVARIGIRLLMPAGTVFMAMTALFYIDARLTFLLFFLMALCIPPLYKINIRGAKSSHLFEKQNKEASNAKKRAIREITAALSDGFQGDAKAMISAKLDAHPIGAAMDSYMSRLRSTEESSFLLGLLMGVAIVAILLFKGFQVLDAGQGWALIAIYFVVLRLCLGALMQAANMLTAINRMYPQLSRYQTFVEQVRIVGRDTHVAPPTGRLWGSTGTSNLQDSLDDDGDDME